MTLGFNLGPRPTSHRRVKIRYRAAQAGSAMIYCLSSVACLVLGGTFHSLASPALLTEAQGLTLEQQAFYEGQKVAVVELRSKPATDVEASRPLVVQKAGEPYSQDKVKETSLGMTGG